MQTIIGIDNGVTGSIGIVLEDSFEFYPIPTQHILNYTKTKSWVNIINVQAFEKILTKYENPFCLVERPMINPMRFKSSVSAIRAFETTQQTLIRLKIPYRFIDSKEWQRKLLPKGLKGSELKVASDEVCRRYMPKRKFKKGNGDGLLIAIYGRSVYSGKFSQKKK